MFDVLVVGAGLAGSVVAERLAEANQQVLVIDKTITSAARATISTTSGAS